MTKTLSQIGSPVYLYLQDDDVMLPALAGQGERMHEGEEGEAIVIVGEA